MEYIPIVVIVTYLAGVTLIGSWFARRATDSSGWAVAGGHMGLLMVAVGVAGTRIGGVGTYGVAGDVMQSACGTSGTPSIPFLRSLWWVCSLPCRFVV